MKKMTYLLNLTLFVVCSQFLFADNANEGGKQMYISFEDAQAALSDKGIYDEGDYRKNNPPGGGESSRDCVNDDSSTDAYGDGHATVDYLQRDVKVVWDGAMGEADANGFVPVASGGSQVWLYGARNYTLDAHTSPENTVPDFYTTICPTIMLIAGVYKCLLVETLLPPSST